MTACVRRQSEEDVEMREVSKPVRRFPILKLPDVVFNEFLRHLEVVDVTRLAFLCFDGIHTTTYTFKEASQKKENEVYMDQKVVKHADWAVDNSSRDQKDYIVYSKCPAAATYTWAVYFRHLFKIREFRLYVKPDNDVEGIKNFLKQYIGMHGRQVTHLVVEVDLDAAGHVTERIHMGSAALRCFHAHSTVMYSLGDPYMYRAFHSTHANLQAALDMKHHYVDLKNATITDEEMSWMVKRWLEDVEDEDLGFRTVSIRRNYARKQIEWDLLLHGVVYERLQDNEAREYGRLTENCFGIEQHPCMGGIDVFREDGEVLSIYVECDTMRVVDPNDEDELVSVPNPDSHVIHFVSWWPDEEPE